MLSDIVENIRKDCLQHGYGRKKWWADRIGIPPLTLSHWLGGRQKPCGKHALELHRLLGEVGDQERYHLWKENLWEGYYSKAPLSAPWLPLVILEMLSFPQLDSRLLALLSRLTEKEGPHFPLPSSGKLRNRLGWLLEISGRQAPFSPDKAVGIQILLSSPLHSRKLETHFRKFQTSTGKRWLILDCPLDALKSSLP